MEKLHRDLKLNQKVAVKYIFDCSGSLIDEDDFLKWLAKCLKYKPCRLKQLLYENKSNRRNSHIQPREYQHIYNFWLSNSINSNESMYNICTTTKPSFMEQYPNITDPNLIEETT